MTRQKRVVALLLAMVVCIVMIFSILFISFEAQHHCAGENCKICYQLDECSQAIRQLVFVAMLGILLLEASVWFYSTVTSSTSAKRIFSLILLKVELLN